MTATPDVRLDDPEHSAESRCSAVDQCCGGVRAEPRVPSRTVTPEQVDCAVAQLRERRGRTAAEQMQSVLRALDLTVAPRTNDRLR